MYIGKLDYIVNEYNNTSHRTIKMKPIDVRSSQYLDFNVGKNDKDPKFEVGDQVRISKYKPKYKPAKQLRLHQRWYQKQLAR